MALRLRLTLTLCFLAHDGLACANLQLQQQREREEREAARAAEARLIAAPTPEQMAATQRRNEEHLERQAQRKEAREVKRREDMARLAELQLQVPPSPPWSRHIVK